MMVEANNHPLIFFFSYGHPGHGPPQSVVHDNEPLDPPLVPPLQPVWNNANENAEVHLQNVNFATIKFQIWI